MDFLDFWILDFFDFLPARLRAPRALRRPVPFTGAVQALHRPFTGALQAFYRCFTGALQALYMPFTGPLQALCKRFYRRFTGALQALYKPFTRPLHARYRPFASAFTGLLHQGPCPVPCASCLAPRTLRLVPSPACCGPPVN